jgi:hypothetical protein
MIKPKWVPELENEYLIYKKGFYEFGMYSTKAEIQNAFLNGKIFVLKGRLIGWRMVIFLHILWPVCFAPIFFLIIALDPESFFSTILLLGVLLITFYIVGDLMMLIFRGYFIVIGPKGVYFRKAIRKRFFSWKNVYYIIEGSKERESYLIGHVVVYLSKKKKKFFDYSAYSIKEFPEEFKWEMFFNLFKIYFELGKQELN